MRDTEGAWIELLRGGLGRRSVGVGRVPTRPNVPVGALTLEEGQRHTVRMPRVSDPRGGIRTSPRGNWTGTFDNTHPRGYYDRSHRSVGEQVKTIEDFMAAASFTPSPQQREAILHEDGPLYLPAGPGSGKTRILLWRSFNLIVFRGADPSRVFLSTFTEKAAHQLRNGLYSLLAVAGEELGRQFDTSGLYVGTLHSLSGKILSDRRFTTNDRRPRPTALMDDLAQTLYLYRGDGSRALLEFGRSALGIVAPDEFYIRVQKCFELEPRFPSRYGATRSLVEFFNRVSEEAPLLDDWKQKAERLGLSPWHEGIRLLLDLYGVYVESLKASRRTDLSLVQRAACEAIERCPIGGSIFSHVIIDEYQDTNTVQERLIFDLAGGQKNLCVVGDDDQALYRFRGATVENFVRFSERVRRRWQCEVKTVPIIRNYRSRGDIVAFFGNAIETADWSDAAGGPPYRLEKGIEADRGMDGPAVFSTPRLSVEDSAKECAVLVGKLIASGMVDDPNRIAFLFPSLKSKIAGAYVAALEALGIKSYAPRAGSFLENSEALLVFGLIGKTIGFGRSGFMNEQYKDWTHRAEAAAEAALESDPALRQFVEDRRRELKQSADDYATLSNAAMEHDWGLDWPYSPERMKRALVETSGISEKARRSLLSKYFDSLARRREETGNPYSLDYAISRAAGLDWSLLDHFYRLCASSATVRQRTAEWIALMRETKETKG